MYVQYLSAVNSTHTGRRTAVRFENEKAIQCCIADRYCYCVVGRHDFFFFLQDCSMHRMLVISLFHHADSSPFCNWYYLFTLSFLCKQTRRVRNIVSCYFFLFIFGRAKHLSREQCVGSSAKGDALCSSSGLQVSQTVTSVFVWSWAIIVYEGIQDLEKWTQYSSFVLVFLCLCLINSVHLTWGLLKVCEACPIPHLNWSSSSVPLGTIRSPLGPPRIQHQQDET